MANGEEKKVPPESQPLPPESDPITEEKVPAAEAAASADAAPPAAKESAPARRFPNRPLSPSPKKDQHWCAQPTNTHCRFASRTGSMPSACS
jgi:hypothetical protein